MPSPQGLCDLDFAVLIFCHVRDELRGWSGIELAWPAIFTKDSYATSDQILWHAAPPSPSIRHCRLMCN